MSNQNDIDDATTLTELWRGYRRYEVLRTFNVQQFKSLYETSITSDIPFDQLVDNIINDRRDGAQPGKPGEFKWR